MQTLMRMAAQLRVSVHIAHLDDDEVLGCYDESLRRIYLSFDLTPVEMRSVLAHELGHAFYGDRCSTGPTERRAQKYAAALLISAEEYAAAELIDPSVGAIAEELNVTEETVQAYKDHCLQRLGQRTYGRSWRVGLAGERARQLSS